MSEPNSIYVSARLSAATEAAQVGDMVKSTEDLDRLIRAVVPSVNLLPENSERHRAKVLEPETPFEATGPTMSRIVLRTSPEPRGTVELFGDSYFQQWQRSDPTRTILARIQNQLSGYSGEKLLRLEDHTDITILNRDGDARVTRNFLTANIGSENIQNASDKIAFEYPPLSFSVYSYDQSDGCALSTKTNPQHTCLKETEIHLARPIEPLSTAAFAVEYSINGLFRFDTFWFSRVHAGCIRQSLSVHFHDDARIRQYRTFAELPTGAMLESTPKARMELSPSGSVLHWEMKFPTCHTMVKTFWCL